MQMKKKLQNKSCQISKLKLELRTWKMKLKLKIAFEMKKARIKGCNFQLHLRKTWRKPQVCSWIT